MARISEVEYQPVEAACFQLMADGVNPSFELVYNIIGRRGSSKVVQDMIGRWRKETAERFFARRSHPSLPDDLVAAGDQLIEKIWIDALAKFDSVFAEKLKELETRLGEMQESVDAAEGVAKEEEKSRLAAESDIKVSHAENASLLERITDLDGRLRDATATLAAREDQIAGMREDLGRITATLEAEHIRHREEMGSERQHYEAAILQLQEKYQAEQARDREIAEGERRHLMMQTEQIRRENKEQVESLKEQLSDVKSRADIFQAKANKSQEDAYFQRGKAEAQEQTITGLQTKIAEMEQTADRARIQRAKLAADLVSLGLPSVKEDRADAEFLLRLANLIQHAKEEN